MPALVATKLVVHPTLVFCAGTLLARAGLPLQPRTLVALVLVAALPSATNVPILAERFGADMRRIARVVLWTTAIAFATFSAFVAALA